MATAEPTSAPATAPTVSPSLVSTVLPSDWTLADLLSSLGGIPPSASVWFPRPALPRKTT